MTNESTFVLLQILTPVVFFIFYVISYLLFSRILGLVLHFLVFVLTITEKLLEWHSIKKKQLSLWLTDTRSYLYWKYFREHFNVDDQLCQLFQTPDQLRKLIRSTKTVSYVLSSFKALVDISRQSVYSRAYCGSVQSGLEFLINERIMYKLKALNLIDSSDLKHLFEKISREDEFFWFLRDSILSKYMLKRNIVTVDQLLEKIEQIQQNSVSTSRTSILIKFVRCYSTIEFLIQTGLLKISHIEHIFQSAQFEFEPPKLFSGNIFFTKHILKNQLLTKPHLKCFTSMLTKPKNGLDSYEERLSRMFDRIILEIAENVCFPDDLEEKPLIEIKREDHELYRLLDEQLRTAVFAGFNLTVEEKLELAELCEKSTVAHKMVMSIVDNDLEASFKNFNELMTHLKKRAKKNLLNI